MFLPKDVRELEAGTVQLLRRLRGVHVRPLLRALLGLQERRGSQQVRPPLLRPRLLLPLRARPAAQERGQGQVQHRGQHLRGRGGGGVLPPVRAVPGGGGDTVLYCTVLYSRWGWRYRTSSPEPRHSQHTPPDLISTIS